MRLVEAAVAFVADRASEAIARRGLFTLALAGGGTPKPVYERLAMPDVAGAIEWSRVHVFFGDERCVPPDDPQSNFRMAREALLARVPIPDENVHRVRGEDPPTVAAEEAERSLRDVVPAAPVPSLDLVFLGLGDDGHTASLFPDTAALGEQSRLVVANFVEKLSSWRVTFTAPLINAARDVVFLVEGAGKAAALEAVLEGPFTPTLLPSQLVRPGGSLHWFADEAAAGRLTGHR
jgi:6-phosphogluconolactonase